MRQASGKSTPSSEPKAAARSDDSPSERLAWRRPWVQLKTYSYHPTIYPAMIRTASPGSRAGDLVTVYDKAGQPFGAGLYNPKARVPLRILLHGKGSRGGR